MSQWLHTITTTYCSWPPDPELVIRVPADDLQLEYCGSQELHLSICSIIAIIVRHVVLIERCGPLRIHLFLSSHKRSAS